MKLSMDKRLTALESKDQERQKRVYGRVLDCLSDDEFACFAAVVRRHNATAPGGDVYVSGDEKQVLCRVEALTLADPEIRPGDLMNIPREWMEECGYAKRT